MRNQQCLLPGYYPGAQNCREELAVGARTAVVFSALASISLEIGVILWLCVPAAMGQG